jgi:hypothetical protein
MQGVSVGSLYQFIPTRQITLLSFEEITGPTQHPLAHP